MNDDLESSDLWQFFAAYFNQDWAMDADDWQGVVDQYASDHSEPEHLQRLAHEIDVVRDSHSESELPEFLSRGLGSYYIPYAESCKEWLTQVTDRLRHHAGPIDTGN
jgi:hypothetical protein